MSVRSKIGTGPMGAVPSRDELLNALALKTKPLDVDDLKDFIKKHKEMLNHRDNECKTLLTHICESPGGTERHVKACLACPHIDPTAGDVKKSLTPLFAAVKRGHQPIVALLLAHRSMIPRHLDATNAQGSTPLMVATNLGHDGIVALLLRHGANGGLTKRTNARTALHIACSSVDSKHLSIARILIKGGASNGIDVNAEDKSGKTALDVALAKRNEELVSVLREAGAVHGRGGKRPRAGAAEDPDLVVTEDAAGKGKKKKKRMEAQSELPARND